MDFVFIFLLISGVVISAVAVMLLRIIRSEKKTNRRFNEILRLGNMATTISIKNQNKIEGLMNKISSITQLKHSEDEKQEDHERQTQAILERLSGWKPSDEEAASDPVVEEIEEVAVKKELNVIEKVTARQAGVEVAAPDPVVKEIEEVAVKKELNVIEKLTAWQPRIEDAPRTIEPKSSEVKNMISFDNITKIDSTISEVKEKIGFLRKVLESVTDAEFSDYEAFLCWERILQHRVELTQKVNRDVNLCVAIVDYFTYVDKTMKNPVTTSKQLLKLSTQR